MANVRKPHKHAEVIRAYADGHDIQMYGTSSWVDTEYPIFAEEYQYRVKPEPKKHKYRVALLRDGDEIWTYTEENGKSTQESRIYFVRYLTDWIEVEV